MVTHEEILRLVQQKGPIIPSDINSELGTNTMIIGAFLSDLVSSKKLKVSYAKLGGSPVYFFESQRQKLERLYKHLNEKDRRAYDELQKEGVLFDDEASPLTKTCLRQLKDFAMPLKVTFKQKEHFFWRWHTLSDTDAKEKIKEKLSKIYPEQKIQHIENKEKNTLKGNTEKEIEQEKKQEKIKKENIQPKEKNPPIHIEKPVQQILTTQVEDSFIDTVQRFLNSKGIKVLTTELVKKKSECNMIVIVPSNIGELQYFCKGKNKKRNTEGDIAAAFVEGQLRNLPVVYVSQGEIPKKITDVVDKKYKNLRVLTLWESQ